MTKNLKKAVTKAGFSSLKDAWHAVRQALMTPQEVLEWTFPRPEGGASKDPASVFAWPRTPEEGFETLYSLAMQTDPYTFYEVLGKSYARDWKPTFNLIPKIKRNEPIQIWRASDVGDIIPGSYVSESKEYSVGHGETRIPGKWKLYTMQAKPSELFTYHDPHEFLYIPEGPEAWLDVARNRVEQIPEWAAEELLGMPEPSEGASLGVAVQGAHNYWIKPGGKVLTFGWNESHNFYAEKAGLKDALDALKHGWVRAFDFSNKIGFEIFDIRDSSSISLITKFLENMLSKQQSFEAVLEFMKPQPNWIEFNSDEFLNSSIEELILDKTQHAFMFRGYGGR